MHRLFAPVVAPLLSALEPRTVLETGAGAGRLTRRVLDSKSAPARLHAVDPAPSIDPRLVEESGGRFVLHAERAVNVIGRVGAVDLALLDGDPSWYSVHTEMTMLAEAAERADRPAPLFLVHNVHWPFGRRDGYYDPEAIPPAHRHEHSGLGLLPGRRDPCTEGLLLTPRCARRDFEPRSGVLTAVEDFVAASELEWTLVEVPGFHGCAALAESRLLEQQPVLARVLDDLSASRFLRSQARRAEAARIEAQAELAALLATTEVPESAPEPEPAAEPEPVLEPEPAAEPEPAVEADPYREAIRDLESERASLVGRLAQQTAKREALEWQLERLEEERAAREARLETVSAERDEDRAGLIEVRVRLEEATAQLESGRGEAASLRRGWWRWRRRPRHGRRSFGI